MTDELTKLNDAALSDRLAAAKSKLHEAMEESTRVTKASEAEWLEAQAQGMTPARVQELKERHERLCDVHVHAVQKASATLDTLEAEHTRRAEQAQADADAALKTELRGRWIRNGGRPDEFEREWPELRRRALTERTLASAQPDEAEERRRQAWRTRL